MIKIVRSALLMVVFLALLFTTVSAQDKTLYWDRFDVNITILDNGDFQVEEIQEITFTNGTFRFGYRAIPLDRVEALTNIEVLERQGDRWVRYEQDYTESPYTFQTYQEEGNQVIYWYFEPTAGSNQTYKIRYLVKGGLRIYPDGDQLWWKAFGEDHNFPINKSTVQVTLPLTFNRDDLLAATYSTPAEIDTDGKNVYFYAQDIPAGIEFETRTQFPHGVVPGTPPDWQAADDRERQIQETVGPILDILFALLSLLLLFGGPVAIYTLWYLKGRDPSAGLVADYLSEPPSDLPPGAAGTLIDEKADMRDILATLVDLAHRGGIHIEEVYAGGLTKPTDHIYHQVDSEVPKHAFEKTLANELFWNKDNVSLSSLKHKFYDTIPSLETELYDFVVNQGYFNASPHTIRTRYLASGVAFFIVTIAITIFMAMFIFDYSAMFICVPPPLILISLMIVAVGRVMPRKTRLGAEEAAKWNAFKRYLENIAKYDDIAEAQENFEQYLPYAIAFGIEKRLIGQFAKIDTPAPRWYGPYGPNAIPYGRPIFVPGSTGSGEVAAPGAPGPLAGEGGGGRSLSDMSRGMGSSLTQMSAGFSGMLSTAHRTMSSSPPSSSSGSSSSFGGGGFSGGGFSGGGGGGGGSAGFG